MLSARSCSLLWRHRSLTGAVPGNISLVAALIDGRRVSLRRGRRRYARQGEEGSPFHRPALPEADAETKEMEPVEQGGRLQQVMYGRAWRIRGYSSEAGSAGGARETCASAGGGDAAASRTV